MYCPPRFKLEKKTTSKNYENPSYLEEIIIQKISVVTLDISKGKRLFESIQEFNSEVQSNCKPTSWLSDLGKIADFFVFKRTSLFHSCIEENDNMASDQTLIVLIISELG